MHELIGERVMHMVSKKIGYVESVSQNLITVNYHGETTNYKYPDALDSILLFENQKLQEKYRKRSQSASFDSFKSSFINALKEEISYLRANGGKVYRIIDGERIAEQNKVYTYFFETDTELHFPDNTIIKLRTSTGIIPATVVSCEEFGIVISLQSDLGNTVEVLEFTADLWQAIEALIERLQEMDADTHPLAHMIACAGSSVVEKMSYMSFGQNEALRKATTEPITIIWGPPGTGKTTTLSRIAVELLTRGLRVLMVSYSNVSVDVAVLKVANSIPNACGTVIRYGYPRDKELIESKYLTSYAFILNQHPSLAEEITDLKNQINRLSNGTVEATKTKNRLGKLRKTVSDLEKELIQNTAFVATTITKAIMDSAVFSQKFDAVIFDEASMAYVPQVVFAAGLAKTHFCCLGDFRQLPAIVQNPVDSVLYRDIFEYTKITEAVREGVHHKWLVMLQKQFRMHPDIADFVGRQMYDKMLESDDGLYEECRAITECKPIKSSPLALLDLSGTYSVCIKTMDGSRVNLMSAMLCVKTAEILATKYQVGIITPYSAQSKLVLAMIRDLQTQSRIFKNIVTATVHQYQGSEKPIIIYDAVDCFRMQYPGRLLTDKKNDNADRLFNVAITRTQGKFILVANNDYLKRKNIAKDLMFTAAIRRMEKQNCVLAGEDLLEELGTPENEQPKMFFAEIDEEDSWKRYMNDIKTAKKQIVIDIPGTISDDVVLLDFFNALCLARKKGIDIKISIDANMEIPFVFRKTELINFISKRAYITTPITIIDSKIIWFGEPLCCADFISENAVLPTKFHFCFRFEGYHTARMLKAIYQIPIMGGKNNGKNTIATD